MTETPHTPEHLVVRVDHEPTDVEKDFATLLRSIESYSRRFRMVRGAHDRATACALKTELEDGETFTVGSSREGHITHSSGNGKTEIDFDVPEVSITYTNEEGEQNEMDATEEGNAILAKFAYDLNITLQVSSPTSHP